MLKLPFAAPSVLAPPKLKVKPAEPEPVFDDAPAKMGAALAVLPFCAGADDAAKIPDVEAGGWLVAPKLNKGAELPSALPPLNIFFLAGDGSSCFMGLPNILFPEAPEGGDCGRLN